VQTTLLDSPDEASVTGVSPAEILADVEGVYFGGIYFQTDTFAPHALAGESRALTLSIAYEGGEIYDHEAGNGGEGIGLGGLVCFDRLVIDVRVHLQSEDGSVDETLVAGVVYEPEAPTHTAGRPVLRLGYDPRELQGGLEVEDFSLPPGASFERLSLDAVVHDGGVSASYAVEYDNGGTTIPIFASLAAVRELTDAACAQISSCTLAGCARAEGREVIEDADGCWCDAASSVCVAQAGSGPATELWALSHGAVYGNEGSDYHVMALSDVAEPLSEPWRSCSELPDVEGCACFTGQNACP
jgi:hypothetical protein